MELNKDNFAEITGGEKTVLIDFWAPWCGPCRMQTPILEELEKELGDDVIIAKVNVDDNQELAFENSVMSIPTLMIYKNGEMLHRIEGLTQKSKLLELLA